MRLTIQGLKEAALTQGSQIFDSEQWYRAALKPGDKGPIPSWVKGTFYFDPPIQVVEISTRKPLKVQIVDESGLAPNHVLIQEQTGYRKIQLFKLP